MARVSRAKIIGGKRLRKLVKTLPQSLKEEIATTIRAELEPLANEARSAVRPRANWFGNRNREALDIRTSVKVRVSARTLRGRVVARVPIEIRKGSGIRKNLARLVELGTNPRHFGRKPFGPHPIAAQPFLFPAWRKRRPRAREAFNAAISRAIEKARR